MDRSSSPENFAAQRRSVVVSPAGCGKTELIVDSVGCCSGRQLVLTHTHAGVDSLRKRSKKKGIPSRSYNLETLDSFALKYAAAYPSLSKIAFKQPKEKGDYGKVIEAANNFLENPLANEILLNSYSGVFVDEYQDCSIGQHKLILKIADTIPCRIVGDYLQGIFDFAGNGIVDWERDVYPNFNRLDNLNEPHRWKDKNPELGGWLLKARECIENKKPINLSESPISWHKQSSPGVGKVLSSLLSESGNTFVICEPINTNNPHFIAKNQKNRYRTIEPITSDEICQDAAVVENSSGEERLDAVLRFTHKCLTGMTESMQVRKKLNFQYKPKLDQRKNLLSFYKKIVSDGSLQLVLDLFNYLETVYTPTYKRYQLWQEMKKGLEGVMLGNYEKLEEAVWKIRNVSTFVGRKMPKRCISRTVLLKGLECCHGIVIDADAFRSKDLYVALTRASNSLHILSGAPILIPKDYRPSCPRCGRELMPRYNEADETSFLGCSKWPKCKHTQSL